MTGWLIRAVRLAAGKKAWAALAVPALALTACGGSATSTSKAPVTFGALIPLTGGASNFGQGYEMAAVAASDYINAHGGVLGRRLNLVVADDQTDPVDAVAALRRLELQSPSFIVGPPAPTIPATVNLFDPAHIVDFPIGGITTLDNNTRKYVWRSGFSDNTLSAAMAAYALHQGYSHCGLLFESVVGSLSEVPPLVAAYTAHGGQITKQVTIAANQNSYAAELESLFQTKPDCVLWSADATTSATLFADIKELGFGTVPFIGDDYGATPEIGQEIGYSFASKWVTGIISAAPSGPAYTTYLKAWEAAYPGSVPRDLGNNVWDSVTIAALAMSYAHSSNPSVWVNDITKVTNPPGAACFTYPTCVALLNAGKKINYSGASGPDDYNSNHNLFGAWSVARFSAAGVLTTIYTVSAKQIAAYARG